MVDSPAPASAGSGFASTKSISFLGGVGLLNNAITTPSLLLLPALFKSAGWLFPTLMFFAASAITSWASIFLARAIALLPGNHHFEHRVEFAGLAKLLFPRWLYLLTIGVLIFTFQASNISAITVGAQVADETLLATAGKSCALVIFSPDGDLSPGWTCISKAISSDSGSAQDSPFGQAYTVSLGYLITLAITIPLGYLNLDDNIYVQVGGVALLFACITTWSVNLVAAGIDTTQMPVAQGGAGMMSVFSLVLFNYGYVATVPSWLNEKSRTASVAPSIVIAVAFATLQYLMLGIAGGLSTIPFAGGADIIAIFTSDQPGVWLASKIFCYIYPFADLLAGIPVYCIIIRYNLLNDKLVPVWVANLFAVVLPWGVALFFTAGNALNDLLAWSAAILFVALNIMLPAALYLAIERHRAVHTAAAIAVGGGPGALYKELAPVLGRAGALEAAMLASHAAHEDDRGSSGTDAPAAAAAPANGAKSIEDLAADMHRYNETCAPFAESCTARGGGNATRRRRTSASSGAAGLLINDSDDDGSDGEYADAVSALPAAEHASVEDGRLIPVLPASVGISDVRFASFIFWFGVPFSIIAIVLQGLNPNGLST